MAIEQIGQPIRGEILAADGRQVSEPVAAEIVQIQLLTGLETRSMADPAKKQAAHGDMDRGLLDVGLMFSHEVVLAEGAFVQPSASRNAFAPESEWRNPTPAGCESHFHDDWGADVFICD